MSQGILFRQVPSLQSFCTFQLFDVDTNSFTYVIGCTHTRKAVLVDPVLQSLDRDIEVLSFLGICLATRTTQFGSNLHLEYLRARRPRCRCSGVSESWPYLLIGNALRRSRASRACSPRSQQQERTFWCPRETRSMSARYPSWKCARHLA